MATATTTALGQAAGTDTRHSAQNVRYKMKFNTSTGQWEQEQIMTPLVQTIYPGIRTKEGKTKDISTGLVSQPSDGFITRGVEPTTPEPEVTPLPVVTDGTPTTGGGGYKEVQEQYKQPIPSTTGGIRYEETQTRGVSESQLDRMKYNVMPGGLNLRSDAQNLSLSQSHGLIEDLINPTVKTKEEIAAQKKKLGMLPGAAGAVVGFLGSAIQPRSEKIQITKMIESGALQVRRGEGYDSVLLSNEDAIKALTQDENGRTKILKGQDLINSGLKVTQVKHMSKDYAQSAAFMNFQEDKARNMNTPTGVKLTTLNPVMGSSGTTLFGIFKDAKGASPTNGEQVLVVGASGGGGYRSDGKFVGTNSQIYAFGTAAQAQESANAGHIPLEVLARMTNEDGTLKDMYLGDSAVGNYAIDSKWIKNGKYIGNVVAENGDVITNGGTGTPINNISDPDSDRHKDFIDNRWEKPVTPTRKEADIAFQEQAEKKGWDTSRAGTQGQGRDEPSQPVEKAEKKEPRKKEDRPKGCFVKGMLVEMFNGTTKPIEQIKIGDSTKGGDVISTLRFEPQVIYNYNNVLVSGSHWVKENKQFVEVENSKQGVRTDMVEPVYTLITQDNRIFINNVEFGDYLNASDDIWNPHYKLVKEKLNKELEGETLWH